MSLAKISGHYTDYSNTRPKVYATHYSVCYRPQGVLRSDEDLSLFDDQFRDKYKKQQVNSFDDEGW